MRTNTAARLPAIRADLEVAPARYTSPRENEIVVENRAVAINPIDWITQIAGDFVFSYIKYPFVLGSDLAGEVVAVGSGVSRFQIGDRVLGHAVGTDPKRNSSAEGSFQTYTVVLADMATPIPSTMSYERAAVLPLGLSTAACGLFQSDHLALDFPTASPMTHDKTVLVWGGSTSVGSNAIQLAVAAGYDVVTTASPKNFDYVRKLGASRAFDYNDPNVVRNVITAFAGKTIAGALAIGAGSAQACVDVLTACEGDKFVSIATFPVTFDGRGGGLAMRLRAVSQFVPFLVSMTIKCRLRGIGMKTIFGSSLIHNDVGRRIYVDFLPTALADGRFVPAPDPRVVGSGLACIQAGLDAQRKGVSASKIVISLPDVSLGNS